MISYLNHKDIDKTLWDECIANALNGNVYAWSWYLDVVHPGWDALVEVTEGKYLTMMPITWKEKFGIYYLCQPFFVQQLGVFSTQKLTQQRIVEFINAIPSFYLLVQIRLNEGNHFDELLKGVEFHFNHLVDLSSDYETLSSHYHENTIRNLKKSLKSNLELVKNLPIATVIDLFRADRGSKVKHWGDEEYARLARLTEVAITSSNAFIYGVKNIDNKDIICGALFMVSHQRITFLFSGNSPAGKESRAMTFLIDQVFREYAGQSFTFDFEGSDEVNLARFYQGFGSEMLTYPALNFKLLNPFHNHFQRKND